MSEILETGGLIGNGERVVINFFYRNDAQGWFLQSLGFGVLGRPHLGSGYYAAPCLYGCYFKTFRTSLPIRFLNFIKFIQYQTVKS